MGDLVERLRSSAKAFREHSVYDSEGDEVRLIAQAEECDEAASEIERLREVLEPLANLAGVNMNDPLRKWLTVGQIKDAEEALSAYIMKEVGDGD